MYKIRKKLHFFIVQSSLKVFDVLLRNSISILFLFRWAYFWIFDRWRILCTRHGRCSRADRNGWNCADPICSSSRTNRQPISNCCGCRSHSPMKSMDDESLNYTISKTLSIIILKEAYFYCFTLLLAQPCQGLPILATRQKYRKILL